MRTEERQAETDRARRIYDRIAPHYDQLSRYFERLLYGGGREWVTSRAHGCVLEIGVGTGRNLPLYPRDVQVIGMESDEQGIEDPLAGAYDGIRAADVL